MKVSQNSKLSRYTYRWDIERSSNICDYMWDIIKATLIYILFFWAIIGVVTLIVPAPFIFPYYVWTISTGLTIIEELNELQEAWLTVGFFEYAFAIYYALYRGTKWVFKPKPTQPTENPKVFRTWWKARKEKICPLIEWED